MPLARTYDRSRNMVTSTLDDGYLDRLSRWSDIQEYLPFLHEQARSRVNPWVLELGTRRGNSTLAFLAGCAETGGHVWSVDVDSTMNDPEGMMCWRGNPYWTFIQGDDMDVSVQVKLPFKVDVLFIDSSHEYDHTLEELRAYVPKVTSGGIVLCHDTKLRDWPDCKSPGEPPVARALDAYCAETGLSWEEIPGVYGLGVLQGRIP